MLDRSSGCPILHVDMDAFFAMVAIRDRPDLAGVPVIVGGGHRGVVLSATYPARAYGVHSAMPMARARKLCPTAVVLSPGHRDFDVVSRSVMEIFRQVTPVVEAASMDEAFLDVSGSVRRLGSPLEIAEHVRARVHDEQRITCSVGVAASVPVAKVASRRAKPDGVLVVPPDQVSTFLHPLDVGELWGVGEKTRSQLHRIGLTTIGDVAHTPVAALKAAIGMRAGAHLHELARGDGRRVLSPRQSMQEPDRSMGADETFGQDTADRAVMLRELLRLSTKVAARMRRAEVAGRTVTLRLRFSDFTTITRSRTLPEPTDVTSEIYGVVASLLQAQPHRTRVRLVGVRIEGLAARSRVHRQLVLGAREHGWADADRAVDTAGQRFGRDAVRPATLLAGDRP